MSIASLLSALGARTPAFLASLTFRRTIAAGLLVSSMGAMQADCGGGVDPTPTPDPTETPVPSPEPSPTPVDPTVGPTLTPDPTPTPGCVLASRWPEILRQRELVLVDRRQVSSVEALTELEQEQLVDAVSATSAEVSSAQEALEAIDEGTANVVKFWDLTAERLLEAYEFGMGDNSFGMFYFGGGLERAARINDGDTYECTASPGPHGGACFSSSECLDGRRCQGVAHDEAGEPVAPGLCVDPAGKPGQGTSCSAPSDCDLLAGLRCSSLTRSTEGLCDAASTAGTFEVMPLYAESIDVPAGGTLEHPTFISGLTTVDTDVALKLYVSHPDVSQLRITLTNPAGNEVTVVARGQASGTEVYLDGPAGYLQGFSGDEQVNGLWILTITNSSTTADGALHDYLLRIGSRWD